LGDFAIFKLVAEAWGYGEMSRAWRSPEDAFQILKKLSRGQPCDFSGIRDYAELDGAGGIQWPWSAAGAAEETEDGRREAGSRSPRDPSPDSRLPSPSLRERRLFADGKFFTPDGRAKFIFDAPRPMPEPADAEFPFLLLTGRGTSAQWHTGSRTNKSAVLRKLAPATLTIEINPRDARRLGIGACNLVSVRSRRGNLEATAVVTPATQPGQLFMPMHFEAVNRLTFPAFDPHSRQPSYKACAVSLSRAPADRSGAGHTGQM
jgi:assimilatory nitrate reductase catalytic subunit